MKRHLLPLAAALSAIASPALAQQDESAERTADSCWIERAGVPDIHVVERIDLSGVLALRVSGPNWDFASGALYPIRLREHWVPPGAPAPMDHRAQGRGFRDAEGWAGIELRNPGGPFPYSEIAIFRADDAEPFAVIDNPYGWMPLSACLTEIAREDRGSGQPPATPARMIGPIETYITREDYPASAWRDELSGDSNVRLTVSAHGVASGCTVTRPSVPVLDSTACRILVRRARFTPARDAVGQVTEGTADATIHWVLPPGRPGTGSAPK